MYLRGGYIITLTLSILLLSSCIPQKRLVNFREDTDLFDEPEPIVKYDEVRFQPNDRVNIQVSSQNEEASAPFNESFRNMGGGAGGQMNQQLIGYLVDPEGYIDYPRLGRIKLGGLTREEAEDKMLELLDPYLEDPLVKIGIVNFRVTIFGEVGGTVIDVQGERLTIVEALAQAGLTAFSQRDRIWVIREQDGKRVFGQVNMYSREIFNSPYFYLKQNDVIYVEPTKDVVTSINQPFRAVIPWITSVISLGTLVFTLLTNN